MEVLHHDEEGADGNHRHDPQHEHEVLGRQDEQERHEQKRDGHERLEAAAHERGVHELELGRALQEHLAVAARVHEHLHDGGQAEVGAPHPHALGVHHVGVGEAAVEERVDVEEVATRGDADEGRRHEEDEQDGDVGGVVAVIEARDGLTHGVDAVGERQPRVQGLEEVGLELDGVGARGARDLQDHEKHAECLADVLERHRDGVDERHVHERAHHARAHEGGRGRALDAEEQVSQAADERLHLAEQHHEQPSAEEPLPGLEGADALAVDLELVDGHEHEAAHPERQVGVEGRHARAVVGHREDAVALHLHRRAQKRARLVRVEPEDLLHGVERLQALDAGHVVGERPHVVGRLVEQARGLGESGGALGQDVVELGERRVGLAKHRRERAHGAHELAAGVGEGIERARELGHRGAGELGLQVDEALRALLDGVVDRAGEVPHRVVAGLDVVGYLLQARELVLLRLRELVEDIDLLLELGLDLVLGLHLGAVGQLDARDGLLGRLERGLEALGGAVERLDLRDGGVDLALGPADVARDLADVVVGRRRDARDGGDARAERLRELGGERLGALARVGERAHGVVQGAGERVGGAGELGERAACARDGVARAGDGALRVREVLREPRERGLGVAQLAHDARVGVVDLAHGLGHALLELLGHGGAHDAHELLGDLLLERGGAGVGDLGRDGVDLLVDVVGDVGLVGVAVEDVGERGGEVRRDDEGGVVGAGLDALLGLVLAHEGPAQLCVLL